MKTKIYLFTLFCVTLFSLGFFIMLFFNIDPYTADNLTITMFFISLLVFLTGLLTLFGFYYRIKATNNELFYINFLPSFRQALLVSVVIVGLLSLKALKVLNIWDGIMFALSILLIELYFQNNKQIKQNEK